jgi:hypothetical protein
LRGGDIDRHLNDDENTTLYLFLPISTVFHTEISMHALEIDLLIGK